MTKELDEAALANVTAAAGGDITALATGDGAEALADEKPVSKKKALKLDTGREFGTVYGSEDGSAFEQDGVLFDVQGLPIKKREITHDPWRVDCAGER